MTVWNRQAENCCQYLKKGRPVHVEGYLKMDSWDDKTTGEKRSKIKVEADRVQFLDSRRDDEGGGPSPGREDDDFAPPPRRPGDPRRPATPGLRQRQRRRPACRPGRHAAPAPRRAARGRRTTTSRSERP